MTGACRGGLELQSQLFFRGTQFDSREQYHWSCSAFTSPITPLPGATRVACLRWTLSEFILFEKLPASYSFGADRSVREVLNSYAVATLFLPKWFVPQTFCITHFISGN